MQGWRARGLFPHLTDLATQITAADELIHKGVLPDRGSVSSFFGRIPPGTAWLLIPGLLVADDPRLFEVPGSALLFLLTLVGIVLVGRALYDETLGWVAACLYALSPIGLFFASSLWPRGHPCLAIWTLYFCFLAVRRSRAVWLVVAASIYLFGLYVFPEIAPVGIAFIVAVTCRPKLLSHWTLPAITVIAILIWAPYVRLQHRVHFVDVARLISANGAVPGEPNWCGEPPQVRMAGTGEPVNIRTADYRYPPRPTNVSTVRGLLSYRIPATVLSLLRNSTLGKGDEWHSRLSALSSVAMFSLVMLGAALSSLFVPRPFGRRSERSGVQVLGVCCVVAASALALVLFALTLMRWADAGVNWGRLDGLYVLSVILLLVLLKFATRRIDERQLLPSITSIGCSAGAGTLWTMLLLSLLAGKLLWSAIAPFDTRRLLWLWPVECLYIALALTVCYKCVSVRWLRVLLVASTIAVLVVPSARGLRARDPNSWSGTDHPIIRLLDRLAAHRTLVDNEERSVSLSYDIPADKFNAAASSVDSRYSIGMGYDLYLKYKHSVSQELVCADSYSPESRYVIREAPAGAGREGASLVEFHPPSKRWDGYELLGQEGRFLLLRRP